MEGAMKIVEMFLQIKLWMLEIASTLSIGMLLVWVLWREFNRLFRHRPVVRVGDDDD
jgi:hypothetical protein